MRAQAPARRRGFGSTDGNELLTSAVAAVLTVLLVVEGVTVVHMRGLVGAHMFVGLVLIPPVVLKLASTGYRFARYYTRSPTYREKGPPRLALRMLAPALVASTILMFTTGVVLLSTEHKAGALLEVHKVSFIVWVVLFGVHFLAYVPHVARSLSDAWRAARPVPGAGVRGLLVVSSLGGGAALALALLPAIQGWRP